MDQLTISQALSILDTQARYGAQYNSEAQRDRQQAYYDGMRTMFEFILTDGFTNNSQYLTRVGGQHLVLENK